MMPSRVRRSTVISTCETAEKNTNKSPNEGNAEKFRASRRQDVCWDHVSSDCPVVGNEYDKRQRPNKASRVRRVGNNYYLFWKVVDFKLLADGVRKDCAVPAVAGPAPNPPSRPTDEWQLPIEIEC